MELNVESFFDKFLRKDSVFYDKKVLQTNFIPENVIHREEQQKQIATILAPALRNEKTSNVFIYGKTGTGKTLTVKHTTNTLVEVSQRENIPLRVIYVNCKMKRSTDTEYRLIAQLARELGKTIPPTGLPTEEVYRIFLSAISKKDQIYLLILDEIDQLVNKTGDNILYNLTRINEETKESQISIIGISNDVTFVDNLDPRVKSSLSEEEIVFPPYNAMQIQAILRERTEKAFKKDTI